ncbi:hypothetical protein ACLOJK_005098 [Asimina triloba]
MLWSEHAGNLNRAVNAHFSEGENTVFHVPRNDFMDIDHPNLDESQGTHLSLPSVATTNHHSTIEDVSQNGHLHEVETRENVRFVNREDGDRSIASAVNAFGNTTGLDAFGRHTGHGDPQLHNVTDYGHDIEEQMVQAAIEASKRDVEEDYANHQFHATDTIEQEKTLDIQRPGTAERGSFSSSGMQDLGRPDTANGSFVISELYERQEFGPSNTGSSNQDKLEAGNASIQDDAGDLEEQPLLRRRSRHDASGSAEFAEEMVEMVGSIPPVTESQEISVHPQSNGDAFRSDELAFAFLLSPKWGGISSEEHDEAIMLEAALFGGIPEGATYHFPYPNQVPETSSNRNADFHWPVPSPPSPTLTAQRLLREQQDQEYLAALQEDREKELKAKEQAEIRHSQEVAAKEASLQEEKYQEEESQRKLLEEEEYAKLLGAKEASLPQEPAADDIGAVTLLVRMPDGSRHGRRFLKSDKLQSLLDFIDISRVVKPEGYRLVRPYPRQAFGGDESKLSLSELGLTSKQEAFTEVANDHASQQLEDSEGRRTSSTVEGWEVAQGWDLGDDPGGVAEASLVDLLDGGTALTAGGSTRHHEWSTHAQTP